MANRKLLVIFALDFPRWTKALFEHLRKNTKNKLRVQLFKKEYRPEYAQGRPKLLEIIDDMMQGCIKTIIQYTYYFLNASFYQVEQCIEYSFGF